MFYFIHVQGQNALRTLLHLADKMALENVGSFQYLMCKIKRYKKKHDLSLKKKKKKKKKKNWRSSIF